MKLTKCDRHPDRDAVATFRIVKLAAVGMRPLLLGYSAGGGTIVDLCAECAATLHFKPPPGR